MTNQELYDRVKKHLLSQLQRSAANGRCLYRGPNGLKCAIGCLIPDERYSLDLEGKSVTRIGRDTVGLRSENLALAVDLQNTHDDFSPEEWEYALFKTAKRHGLDP